MSGSKTRVILVLTAFFISIPAMAFAWGPLTHVYLGTEVFYLGAAIPAGIYSLLRRYRQDFLYGNIMADMIIGKKYIQDDKNPHSWDVAMKMLESADNESEKAFSYGYLCHLAADTVAHGRYTHKTKNIGHAFLEMKADSLIDKKYWREAIEIGINVQRRNDLFLERTIEKLIFSHKTNRRIFKGMVIMSGLHNARFIDLIERNTTLDASTKLEIEKLHELSLDRIVDVLTNGADSVVMKKNPIHNVKRGRILSGFFPR